MNNSNIIIRLNTLEKKIDNINQQLIDIFNIIK